MSSREAVKKAFEIAKENGVITAYDPNYSSLLSTEEDAKEFLARRGFNPMYGARPLKRVIRQMVENPLSKLILSQKFIEGDKIKIDVKDDEIVFEK